MRALRRGVWAACAAACAAIGLAVPAAAEPIDCTGPAADAAPNTLGWHVREAESAWCATQRVADTHANPLYAAAQANRLQPGSRLLTAMDPMREPTLHHGTRFRFHERAITDATGTEYPTFVFRPCAPRADRCRLG